MYIETLSFMKIKLQQSCNEQKLTLCVNTVNPPIKFAMPRATILTANTISAKKL